MWPADGSRFKQMIRMSVQNVVIIPPIAAEIFQFAFGIFVKAT